MICYTELRAMKTVGQVRLELIAVKQICPIVPPVVGHPLSFPRGGWGTVTYSTQIFFLQLTMLLWQNHHPRVLPKAIK